jgi:hypothetical protein
MQATKVTRPSLSFQEVALHRYNSIAYVPGKHSWGEMRLSVEDDIAGTASKVIQEQLQKQQQIIGAEGPFLQRSPEGSLFKFATILEQLDGQEQVVERWVMQGCFIKNAEWGESAYSSTADVLTIELTIRYDHAFQEIGGYNAGQGIALGGSGT